MGYYTRHGKSIYFHTTTSRFGAARGKGTHTKHTHLAILNNKDFFFVKTPSVSREKRRENGIHIAYIPLLPSIKMRGRTASTQPPPRIIFHQNFFMRKSLRAVRMPTQLFALFLVSFTLKHRVFNSVSHWEIT